MSRLRMPTGSVEVASVGSVEAASVLARLPELTLVASSLCDRVTCSTQSPVGELFFGRQRQRPTSELPWATATVPDPLVASEAGIVPLTISPQQLALVDPRRTLRNRCQAAAVMSLCQYSHQFHCVSSFVNPSYTSAPPGQSAGFFSPKVAAAYVELNPGAAGGALRHGVADVRIQDPASSGCASGF
jgi:hypothetical protein